MFGNDLVKLAWRSEKVAVLALDNPKVNSLCVELRNSLLEKLEEVIKTGAQVLVLTGEGKGFTAGAHLPELIETLRIGERATRSWLLDGHDFVNKIAEAPIYKIALLHGFAMAGGLELALACNFRIAVGELRVSLPETKIKIFPGWQGTIRTRMLMPNEAMAREFYETGKELSAKEAKDANLLTSTFFDLEEAWKMVDNIARVVAFGIVPAKPDNLKGAAHDSALEIERFIDKVRPREGEFISPAIKAIENFLSKK